ncbi:putative myosin light chain [Gregarina niphandrodes]|uniref:Calmodulin n=1 Tax=Gregarina niphandrodes TaxID=110365 RepID=A0A023B2W1_GRENI|nr:putative myosin light chain [Gregarina niphandrodes]EZG55226.1 putative myosin light chain [Gregarina niphandrodes]|eukprot:XP_011131707.1 putative myosin light chain [Gregarina niphandrodes]
MAMLCRDLCRDLLPPAEYFDYGLWIPAGRYRADSDIEEPSDDEVTGSVEKTQEEPIPTGPVLKPNEVESMMKEITGSTSGCTPEQAADVARRLGGAPSLAEIQELKARKGQNISAKDIEEWMKTCGHNDTVDNLVKFFEHYDKSHSGKLTRNQLSHLLRTYGEPLTDAEFNAILADMGMTGDQIDYRAFVAQLLN